MKRIGVVVRPSHPQHDEVVRPLVDWLHQRQQEVFVIDITKKKRFPVVEMVIVLGGDGTLLSVARRLAGQKVLVLAVNLGRLGFLTEVTFKELYPTLERILKGQFLEDRRQTLQCVVLRDSARIPCPITLNEVAIHSGALAKLIELSVSIDHHFVTTLRANGVLISTPTGSTAYALSAGGPIVYPSVEALVLAPIAPHMLTQRPLVIPAHAKIEVTLKTVAKGPVAMFDGNEAILLKVGDAVRIQVSEAPLVLVRSPHRNYYQVLREKLKWGEE